jgi:transcriptional regulator GlxA family with amidase domain
MLARLSIYACTGKHYGAALVVWEGMDGTNTVDRRIAWAVGYMQRHLEEPIAIPALAARVNLSPSRFRQLFRDELGLAPAQYQQRLRLRRARLLIERTFLTVKEVMVLVGYSDPSHFSRDFRRLHGVAPSALREPGVPASMQAPGSSLGSPTQSRIRTPRARDPGLRCA